MENTKNENASRIEVNPYDLENLCRALLPSIRDFYATEEGMNEYLAWCESQGEEP